MTTEAETDFDDLLVDSTEEQAPDEAPTAEPVVNKDIETLVSEPGTTTLMSGTKVSIERLRTLQAMDLLKILTAGAGDVFSSLRFDETVTTEQFTGTLIGSIILSVPEAKKETIEFLNGMVKPYNLIKDPRTKPEKESNEELEAKLREELANPELDDLISIVEQIVTVEGPHLMALGKRLALLLKLQTQSETAKQKTSSKKDSKA